MKQLLLFIVISIFCWNDIDATVSNSSPYDTARIFNVMAKARRGENITLGFIGGSITQGSLASAENKRWVNLVADWWKAKFPNAKFTIVNAGIGGTGSDIGTFRVQKDLLAKKPDFVMIEFSVNDAGANGTYVKKMMEGLLRQVLVDTMQAGVMMLQLKMENGGTAQADHKEVGNYYKIPMISEVDQIDSALKNDGHTLRDFFGDNPGVHPNDLGMQYIAKFITRELDVIAKALPADANLPAIGDVQAPLVSDVFQHTFKYTNTTLIPVSKKGWDKWTCTTPGDEIVFNIEGNAITVEYTKDDTKDRGQVEVWVDNGTHKVLDAYFTETWGTKFVFELVAENLSDGEHQLHIKGIEASTTGGHNFYLTAVGKAGNFRGSYPVAVCQKAYKAVKNGVLSLDGTKSFDPDGDTIATYKWEIIAKPNQSTVKIQDSTAAIASFTPDVAGMYTLGFEVGDGIHTSTLQQFSVNTKETNTIPVANAGNDTTVATNKILTLNSGKSIDADGDAITAKWRIISQPAGGKATISAKLAIKVALEGTYKIGLIVNDSIAESPEDTLVITSIPNYTTAVTNTENEKMGFFPNPANDVLHFQGMSSAARFQISDLSGRVVMQKLLTSETGSLNISGLKAGMYMISIKETDGKMYNSNLMIKR